MKSPWFTLLLTAFLSGSCLQAQVLEFPQFKPRNPGDTEMTPESSRAQIQQSLDRYDARFATDPDKEEKIRKTKFQILFRGINWYFNIDFNVPTFQAVQLEIIHEHPEWAPLIQAYCVGNPFEPSSTKEEQDALKGDGMRLYHFRALDMLPHHPGCTWENSREVYREVLARYRMARHYLNLTDRASVEAWQEYSKLSEEARKSLMDPPQPRPKVNEESYLRMMVRSIPGIIARFPTAEGVEQLCQQMEAWPGAETLSAANALSICTAAITVERVRRAYTIARQLRMGNDPDPKHVPLEYLRLERRLADLNADLSGMIEGAGFRFIKPDWNAAKDTTWNLTPPPSTQPQPFAAAAVLPAQSASACWPWWLLALLPVGFIVGWVLGRRLPPKV